jgi:hypothetical protein
MLPTLEDFKNSFAPSAWNRLCGVQQPAHCNFDENYWMNRAPTSLKNLQNRNTNLKYKLNKI